jgi:hypothetical protein
VPEGEQRAGQGTPGEEIKVASGSWGPLGSWAGRRWEGLASEQVREWWCRTGILGHPEAISVQKASSAV